MDSKPTSQSFDDLCAKMAAELAASLRASSPTMEEAAAAFTAIFGHDWNDWDEDDGVIDAPAVEYCINGHWYDEHGCEIEPTLPFDKMHGCP